MKKVYDVRDLSDGLRVALLEKLHRDGVSGTKTPPGWLCRPEVEVLVFDQNGGIRWTEYEWATAHPEYKIFKPTAVVDYHVDYQFSFEEIKPTPKLIVVDGHIYQLVR